MIVLLHRSCLPVVFRAPHLRGVADNLTNLGGIFRISASAFLLTFLLSKFLGFLSFKCGQVSLVYCISHVKLLIIKLHRQGHIMVLVSVVYGPHELRGSLISLNLILCIQNLFDLLVPGVWRLFILHKLLN